MSTDSTGEYDGPVTEEITVTVNGEPITAEVEPRLKLSDFLRNECGLRGVRVGCEHGVCGACTVQQEGRTVKSCLSYAVQADGKEISTVEGLAEDGSLHPIQEAFHETHALQCGFCTSGFVMAAKELIEENPDPSREEIEEGLADNICRCTGYQNIYEAVERAADEMDATAETETGTGTEE
ncbi:2Fe-2S iron-sulfur cluster binding domain-containing protein [Natronorubrum sp. JWXQ-INN-674]|uniref:2Fe-2S iron-sulfur cluster binding domain-containing protein n=1 Tax=Natronorubrum halalkaliphilum TaxID=2691917 RepID=A0A6B0VPE0_9EURY|nr:(2Fe-2S)-binding protein [Natronorubrum halalkaliphilum]MXV62632.1 2Fe-2S iron-sulfur cluster binding domain-containing protein [Natronorubrum halalkaliphilum]